MPSQTLPKHDVIKSLAQALLKTVPLAVWQQLFPKDVIALGYHVISDEDLDHVKYYPYKNADQFDADVAYIVEHQRLIDYDDLVGHRLYGAGCASNSFIFTFDDGFAECFNVVRPILQKHGASGVFFVTTDLLDDRRMFFESKVSLCLTAIGRMEADQARDLVETHGLGWPSTTPNPSGRCELALMRLQSARIATPATPHHRSLVLWLLSFERDAEAEIDRACELTGVDLTGYSRYRPLYLTSDEVRQLAADHFTVGSHGLSHMRLQHLSHDQIEQEIVASCQVIRELTGQKRVPFAFPYSGEGVDRAFLADLLERHRFIDLFFDTQELRRDLAFIIHRLCVDSPSDCGDGGTNLPVLLRRAWSRRSAWTWAESRKAV